MWPDMNTMKMGEQATGPILRRHLHTSVANLTFFFLQIWKQGSTQNFLKNVTDAVDSLAVLVYINITNSCTQNFGK
jgi:hypothetical protein